MLAELDRGYRAAGAVISPAGGRLRTDQATLMRIFAGRAAGPASYELGGAAPAELVVF